jgi:hypothetical protein
MGGVGDSEEMCTLQPVTVWCFCGWQGLENRSMRIQDLYVGTFHGLLGTFLFTVGGGMYIVKERLYLPNRD